MLPAVAWVLHGANTKACPGLHGGAMASKPVAFLPFFFRTPVRKDMLAERQQILRSAETDHS
jgi:hypothetical protein